MAQRRQGPRRHYDWAGSAFNEVALTTTQVILASFTDVEPITFMRARGNLLIHAVPDASGDNVVAAFGLIVVSAASAAVGGTSVNRSRFFAAPALKIRIFSLVSTPVGSSRSTVFFA